MLKLASRVFKHDGNLVVVIASGQNIDRAVRLSRSTRKRSGTGIDPYQAYVL